MSNKQHYNINRYEEDVAFSYREIFSKTIASTLWDSKQDQNSKEVGMRQVHSKITPNTGTPNK